MFTPSRLLLTKGEGEDSSALDRSVVHAVITRSSNEDKRYARAVPNTEKNKNDKLSPERMRKKIVRASVIP